MDVMASKITGYSAVSSKVCSVDSSHKEPVPGMAFPYWDIIMDSPVHKKHSPRMEMYQRQSRRFFYVVVFIRLSFKMVGWITLILTTFRMLIQQSLQTEATPRAYGVFYSTYTYCWGHLISAEIVYLGSQVLPVWPQSISSPLAKGLF